MCSGRNCCLQVLQQDRQTSDALRLLVYPCWHQSLSRCCGSEPCGQPGRFYSLAQPVKSLQGVWMVARGMSPAAWGSHGEHHPEGRGGLERGRVPLLSR